MNNLEKMKQMLEYLINNNIPVEEVSDDLQKDIYRYEIKKQGLMKMTKMEKLLQHMDLRKIELFLDTIIENNEIEDAIDWLIDLSTTNNSGDEIVDLYATEMENLTVLLITQLYNENFELCAKVRDVIQIVTNDCIRLIKMKNVEKDVKADLLNEIKFIYDLYKLSLNKLIEEGE